MLLAMLYKLWCTFIYLQRERGYLMKNKTTALILSILVGGLGVDRFYLGYVGMGILKLLTGGVFGIVYLIDIIRIATGSLAPADGSPYEEDYQKSHAIQAPVAPAANVYDDLQKIANLHSQGVLSDAEYERMKADLMRKI